MQNEIHIFMFAKMKNLKALLCVLLLLGAAVPALACSRVVYKGDKGIVLVGRTLDWRTPIPTNLYVYPAGMQKESMNSGQRLTASSSVTFFTRGLSSLKERGFPRRCEAMKP